MIETKFTATENDTGKRIEVLAAGLFPDVSRTRWQRHGQFWLEAKERPGKTKVSAGETWTVKFNPPAEPEKKLESWDFPLNVLAETKYWLAIDKPVGISVHPSATDPTNKTVVNALIAQFSEIGKHFDDVERPGIVHRLDKPTSGVLLVAKTPEAHKKLQEQWSAVEKTYLALVQGRPPRKGKIEAGIARDTKNRQRMAVSSGKSAKHAESFFERLAVNESENLSLLQIAIPTGRTHQIRVHFSAIGFPILGDEKYGGAPADRLFLHAWKLTVPDPETGKLIKLEAPIPKEFLDKMPDLDTLPAT